MFALIETCGATHIAVYIPHEGAEKSLPALAAMLEQNAVFIQKGWREQKITKAKMQIILGDTLAQESGDTDEILIVVPESNSVIEDSFVHASPEVFVSNAKVVKAKGAEIERLRSEVAFQKIQLDQLREKIQSLTDDDYPGQS